MTGERGHLCEAPAALTTACLNASLLTIRGGKGSPLRRIFTSRTCMR